MRWRVLGLGFTDRENYGSIRDKHPGLFGCFKTEMKIRLLSNSPKSDHPNLHLAQLKSREWKRREKVSDKSSAEPSPCNSFYEKSEWIKSRGITLKLLLIESLAFGLFNANWSDLAFSEWLWVNVCLCNNLISTFTAESDMFLQTPT